MLSLLRRYWFPLALAGGMIAFEMAIASLLLFGQPEGWRWLGNTLQTPSDTAVYLAEIRGGDFFLRNSFAVEPHAKRFDLVWSPLALIHGLTGASPILLHELARWLFTIFLAFVLYAAARSVAADEPQARFGSLLAAGGVGLGWIHAVILGVGGWWTPVTEAAPDLARELAVAPVLLGGAHGVLSLALLLTAMRGIWKSVHDRARPDVVTPISIVALTFFHPYFIPLIFAMTCLAWAKKLGKRPAQEQANRPALACLAAVIPSAAYYGWLIMTDPVFGEHHVTANVVPLPPFWGAVFALAPAIAAIVWVFIRAEREEPFLKSSRWLLSWLICVVALLALPVPWRGKLLEGLMIPLALAGLPAWHALYRLLPKPGAGVALGFIVAASPLFFIASHVSWLSTPDRSWRLGQPNAVFRAWDFLASKPGAVVLADDLWLGTWTPAWSNATTWIGHSQETSGFTFKREDWEDLRHTKNASLARNIIQRSGATHLFLSSDASMDQIRALVGNDWKAVFKDGTLTILERR